MIHKVLFITVVYNEDSDQPVAAAQTLAEFSNREQADLAVRNFEEQTGIVWGLFKAVKLY